MWARVFRHLGSLDAAALACTCRAAAAAEHPDLRRRSVRVQRDGTALEPKEGARVMWPGQDVQAALDAHPVVILMPGVHGSSKATLRMDPGRTTHVFGREGAVLRCRDLLCDGGDLCLVGVCLENARLEVERASSARLQRCVLRNISLTAWDRARAQIVDCALEGTSVVCSGPGSDAEVSGCVLTGAFSRVGCDHGATTRITRCVFTRTHAPVVFYRAYGEVTSCRFENTGCVCMSVVEGSTVRVADNRMDRDVFARESTVT